MKYKAVISDLDGTLLNSDHTISQYTQEIIRKIVAKGIKFYIATGRHHLDAVAFKNMLGLDSFLISSNGAKVHDKDNKEIFSVSIPKDTTAELINITSSTTAHKSIYADDIWYVEKPLDIAEDFHKESAFTYTVKPFEKLKDQNITKIFFISEDEEELSILHSKIDKKLKDKVAITLSLSSCLEVMNLGVSKGNAIKNMLEIEGIALEDAVAFGDGLNDYEMLSVVGKGCLMGNHTPKLKHLLPHSEVVKSNDEDGVANKLKELFLD